MPQYEYFCHSCQKPFSKTLTLQYEEGEIACPDCGSKEVEQAVTTFFASAPNKELNCGGSRLHTLPFPRPPAIIMPAPAAMSILLTIGDTRSW